MQLRKLVFAAGLLSAVAAHPVTGLAQDAGPPQNDLLNATLWMQNSVEFKANALTVFTAAAAKLDQALADKTWSATGQTGDIANLPPAIIFDLDETLIDNNAYEAGLITSGKDFDPKAYNQWAQAAAAKAIPGAVDFAKLADSKGVKLFYVTNRTADQEDATRKNLEALGFPMGGNVDTFLMSKEHEDWTGRKQTRRDFIGKDYRVVMLFGDNYGDFSDDAGKGVAERLASFQANRAHFGKDWFMIANPEYGSFESAPFGNNFKLPQGERRKMKIDVLEPWTPPAQ